MKKVFLTLMMVISVTAATMARDRYSHDVKTLPSAAQSTLNKNFKADLSVIKIDEDFGRVSEYEVLLTDGTEITFDRNGNWTNVETACTQSVPQAFVMKSISHQVNEIQPGTHITGIEKERSGYDVELSNGVDMKFDKQGTFVRYYD